MRYNMTRKWYLLWFWLKIRPHQSTGSVGCSRYLPHIRMREDKSSWLHPVWGSVTASVHTQQTHTFTGREKLFCASQFLNDLNSKGAHVPPVCAGKQKFWESGRWGCHSRPVCVNCRESSFPMAAHWDSCLKRQGKYQAQFQRTWKWNRTIRAWTRRQNSTF